MEFLEEDEGNKLFDPKIFSPLKITPEKIAITALKKAQNENELQHNMYHVMLDPLLHFQEFPVEPPTVNINKNRSAKSDELVLSCNNGGFPRYVLNQLKIFVPVGKDIKIVTPEK